MVLGKRISRIWRALRNRTFHITCLHRIMFGSVRSKVEYAVELGGDEHA
jgi:hypothetical protein